MRRFGYDFNANNIGGAGALAATGDGCWYNDQACNVALRPNCHASNTHFMVITDLIMQGPAFQNTRFTHMGHAGYSHLCPRASISTLTAANGTTYRTVCLYVYGQGPTARMDDTELYIITGAAIHTRYTQLINAGQDAYVWYREADNGAHGELNLTFDLAANICASTPAPLVLAPPPPPTGKCCCIIL